MALRGELPQERTICPKYSAIISRFKLFKALQRHSRAHGKHGVRWMAVFSGLYPVDIHPQN